MELLATKLETKGLKRRNKGVDSAWGDQYVLESQTKQKGQELQCGIPVISEYQSEEVHEEEDNEISVRLSHALQQRVLPKINTHA